MTRRWWFAPLYLWALPSTVIGLILALVYQVHTWRWVDGCLEMASGFTYSRNGDRQTRIWGRPAAQTHGFIIFYEDNWKRVLRPLRIHERCHVVQCLYGGIFFTLAYALSFLWFWVWSGLKDWKIAYNKIPFERQAYRVQREYKEGKHQNAWGTKL